ncbi:MAG: hypothetical protein QM759_02870 [Terricaulis sp.]
MTFTKANVVKGAVLAALMGGAFFAASAPASAAVVCNRWGECWRVNNTYRYPPRFGIVIRSDAWVRAHPHYRWRAAHPGRGYWQRGRWHRW